MVFQVACLKVSIGKQARARQYQNSYRNSGKMRSLSSSPKTTAPNTKWPPPLNGFLESYLNHYLAVIIGNICMK